MNRGIWRQFDYLLFGSVVILIVFGIAMIQSAAAGNENILESVPRQGIFSAVALFVIITLTVIDYKYWASVTNIMYLFVFIFLFVIFAMGMTNFGSARWIDTGFFLIQPSELAKIVIILVLADFFARNENRPHGMRWVLQSLLITGGLVAFIIAQPDLSTSIVILVIWFAMIWISGIQLKQLGILGLIGFIVGILFFIFLMEDYQKTRILQFLFPDPNESYGNTYNVNQALISIGSGGWFGQGYGQATQVQLRFLKVRHTDFIFSAMAAEFGFVGTVLVVALIFFVIFRCVRAARLATDTFGSLIAYGFAILIFFQTAVNIGVNLNVVPVTGLTLPFISYGGSSLLSLGLGIGLVESVISHRQN